jgi:NDP-sugar pyrophosphorylase family protein
MSSIEAHAVILAAGKGSRLGFTEGPKSMVEVAHRPLLSYPLEALHKSSFGKDNITIVLGHQGVVIANYCGDDVRYKTQEQLNGNASALKIGIEDLQGNIGTILALQGDDCLFLDEQKVGEALRFHERRNADITIVLSQNYEPRTHGHRYILSTTGQVLDIEPETQDGRNGLYLTGTYIFNHNYLKQQLPELKPNKKNEFGISDLLRDAISVKSEDKPSVYGYIWKGLWIGINTPEQLSRARRLV